ncbi:hypothetical protein L6270_04200 [Candidatus Parcubacteria bacterium]|nr:hypothetical protein [Patescibacteria group bacterium]MBU4309165.1 hypothetical protein [Patescibacteria group bacterium]MBU4432688.1 hypothetical protein [Patescibacteria group bacterium]MBU4577526.1 hypothetical protein [Patescibacteria group bacterium]MCG2697213.1 hypothetical protein [Candidatus Parcubacteria bacterium]
MKIRIKGVRKLVIQYFFNAVFMMFSLLAFLVSFFMPFFRLCTREVLPSSVEQLGWILSASLFLGITCYLLYFVGPSIMNKINTTLEYADPA